MRSNEIIDAVMRNDSVSLSALLESGGQIDQLDSDGRTPLMHAVIDRNHDLAVLLLKWKANPNIQEKGSWTALHFAAQECETRMVRLLLENGAEVDAKDEYGNTPLWRAVFNSEGRGEVIRLLLSHGADKDISNNHGITPSGLAETIANYDVAQFLK